VLFRYETRSPHILDRESVKKSAGEGPIILKLGTALGADE